MSTIHEIEIAVSKLSRQELSAFRDWFSEFDAAVWDKQLEADVAAGHLDALADEAIRRSARGALYGFVRYRANPKFWNFYAQLPENIQRLGRELQAAQERSATSVPAFQKGWQNVVCSYWHPLSRRGR